MKTPRRNQMSESFIFEQQIRPKVEESEFYTVLGMEDFLDKQENPRLSDENSQKVLAKKIVRADNSIRYSVKVDNRGKAQNPISIYGSEIDNSFLDRICRSNDKFKDVSEKAFSLYVKFLKTKNVAWLHNAEREME
jgi:hypothetical protein